MKILLTSTGLSHKDIEKSFSEMVGKPYEEISVLFIENASTNEIEQQYVDKSFAELIDLGVLKKHIQVCHTPEDLLDISQIKQDVIYVCGGNSFHLLRDIRKTNFGEKIKEAMKKDVVYLGVSAGSIVLTPKICIASIEPADENFDKVKNLSGLSIVDFEVSVHSPEIVTFDSVEQYAKGIKNIIYAISNETAIKIVEDDFQIIGKQLFRIYNKI
jgi:dipeptidase E